MESKCSRSTRAVTIVSSSRFTWTFAPLPRDTHHTFLDITTMKSRSSEARRIAQALAANYEASIPVDTIVCMDGLEVVGAYLAEELTKAGVLSMNAHQTIYITSPEYNSVGQMISGIISSP